MSSNKKSEVPLVRKEVMQSRFSNFNFFQLKNDISSLRKESIKYIQSIKDDVGYTIFTQIFLDKSWVASETERVKKIQIIPNGIGFATNTNVRGFKVNLL